MAVSVSLGTPLAEALSNVVRPKLVEVGWSSDAQDDSALAEYIILMLVNGKTQEQISSELSNDLLNLGPDDTEAVDFSKWLFEQVDLLNQQLNGGAEPETKTDNQEESTAQAIPTVSDDRGDDSGGQDADMGDAGQESNDGGVPTGPKAMRNGKQAGRGRMMGQISKAMDRSNDSMLHRVRSQPGSGRINTHAREMPKGPRNFQGPNNRMPPGRPPMGGGPMGMQPGMGMPGQMPRGGGPGANMMQMNPQQQMQMMALLEEQARMMAQFVPGMVPPAINPAFQGGGNPNAQQGRSLFERVERQHPKPQNGNFGNRAHSNGFSAPRPNDQDTDMKGDMDTKPDTSSATGMEVDRSSAEPGPDSVCRYNLKCTKRDCPYAHQSPAALEGVPVDVSDHCPFGAACKNRKCLGRHPSPAQKMAHQSEELCRFFPNCTNPNCAFKHPSMPMCRNGADCSVEGCKFSHLQIACKFHPCLNRSCPYKHTEGQRGAFTDKVWKADGTESQENTHLSERKFTTDEDGEEELIKPADPSTQNQEPLST